MHYSFWLCDKKKKKDIFYTFYHSDAHESILVLFISSYWSIHMLFRCSLTSYPALCLLTELGGGGEGCGVVWECWGRGVAFVIRFEIIPQWKMWGRVYSKRVNISAHSLTSCHSVYKCFLCLSSISSVLGVFSEGKDLFDRDSWQGAAGGKEEEEEEAGGRRFQHFTNSIGAVTHKHSVTLKRQSNQLWRGDSLGEKMCNK